MRQLFVFLFFFCAAICAAQTSEVAFVIKNFGINVDGHFNTFDIEIKSDKEGAISQITGTVTVQSIETGIDSRDEHLLNEDYFDAANFQKIKLASSSIQPLNNGSYKVVAKLTIKGVTKSIEIIGFLSEDRYGTKFTTEFEINRRDYGIGGSSFSLSKTVQVTVIHYLNP